MTTNTEAGPVATLARAPQNPWHSQTRWTKSWGQVNREIAFTPGRDTGPDADYIERLAADIWTRTYTETTIDAARVAARNCLAQAKYAAAKGVLPPGGASSDPCFGMNVFMPGFDTGNLQLEQDAQARGVPPKNYATPNVHIFAALTGQQYPNGTFAPRVNPAWYYLNFRSRAKSTAPGQWYYIDKWSSPCLERKSMSLADKALVDCDEFPFKATVQINKATASTRLTVKGWNQHAGQKYGAFVDACLGGHAQADATSAPFMVVPMVAAGSPPTTMICSGRRR